MCSRAWSAMVSADGKGRERSSFRGFMKLTSSGRSIC